MTPEERFERIERILDRTVERQDALAETVGILAGMQRASEDRLAHSERRFAHYEELFAQNEVRLAQLMDTMNRMANIIVAHDQSLDNLENQ